MQHCAGFISAESLYMFRASSAHHQEYLKLQVPALIRRCDDLPATITHVPVGAVLVLNTPDDGRLTPETCRVTAEIKPAQCCIKLVFHLTESLSTFMHFPSYKTVYLLRTETTAEVEFMPYMLQLNSVVISQQNRACGCIHTAESM